MENKDLKSWSLLSINTSEGLSYKRLRPLTPLELKVIEEMAETNQSLEGVSAIVRMFKQAMSAWHEGLTHVAKHVGSGGDCMPELNLRTINVLSAFFVLDCYTVTTLSSLHKAELISNIDSKAWSEAPEEIKRALKLAKTVRGALHHSLPIKSYRRLSDKDGVTLSVELCAHSGRGLPVDAVCAISFMAELDALLAYAVSMWSDLIPRVLARLDETCKSLAREVNQAGGGEMTVGHANIDSDGRLKLEYLRVSACPVDDLLARFGK